MRTETQGRRAPLLATALLAIVLVAVVVGAALSVPIGGPAEPRWVPYTDPVAGVAFTYPEQWQVTVTDDPGIEITTRDGQARIQPAANPDRLTASQWASRHAAAEETELLTRPVGQSTAAMVTRADGHLVFISQDDQLWEIAWRGEKDQEFDGWLAGLIVFPPASPAPGTTSRPSPASPVPARATSPEAIAEPTPSPEADPPGREFDPDEFVALFYRAGLPGVAPIGFDPKITGDTAADQRIVDLATERGYRKQREATVELASVAGERLQPQAAQAWEQLVAYASAQGVRLELISGYRSVADQQEIFLQRLAQQGQQHIGRAYTPAEIADGKADQAIDLVLETSSIPGYSKHHTGYALDVHDADSDLPFTRFGQTAGYDWLVADNFANAKRFGLIPSYPDGAEQQGPQPEEWELVWVGTESLQ